jgi:hypothetical protein
MGGMVHTMENMELNWVAFLPILEVLVEGEFGPSYRPLLCLNLMKSWGKLWVDLAPNPL